MIRNTETKPRSFLARLRAGWATLSLLAGAAPAQGVSSKHRVFDPKTKGAFGQSKGSQRWFQRLHKRMNRNRHLTPVGVRGGS